MHRCVARVSCGSVRDTRARAPRLKYQDHSRLASRWQTKSCAPRALRVTPPWPRKSGLQKHGTPLAHPRAGRIIACVRISHTSRGRGAPRRSALLALWKQTRAAGEMVADFSVHLLEVRAHVRHRDMARPRTAVSRTISPRGHARHTGIRRSSVPCSMRTEKYCSSGLSAPGCACVAARARARFLQHPAGLTHGRPRCVRAGAVDDAPRRVVVLRVSCIAYRART